MDILNHALFRFLILLNFVFILRTHGKERKSKDSRIQAQRRFYCSINSAQKLNMKKEQKCCVYFLLCCCNKAFSEGIPTLLLAGFKLCTMLGASGPRGGR